MSDGQRFETDERFSETDPVVARQGRLALGWVVAIVVAVALFVLLVVALLLRSGWWIDEGPVASLSAARSPTLSAARSPTLHASTAITTLPAAALADVNGRGRAEKGQGRKGGT